MAVYVEAATGRSVMLLTARRGNASAPSAQSHTGALKASSYVVVAA